MSNSIRLFLLILTNAGGEGKTTLALLIRGILDLASLDSFMLDADQGTWALKNQFGDDVDTDIIPWNMGPEAAEKIVTKAASKPVTMDSGANMLAAFSPISNLIPALQKRFAEAGYRTVALFPLSPNKSGGARGINHLTGMIQDYEKFVVLNHRDRSGAFGDVRDDLPQLHVPHLQSGLQAYLSECGRRLADVVLNPDQDYVTAAAHIGEWIRQFANDPIVRDVLTAELCDRAIHRLPPTPVPVRFHLDTMADVTDSAFRRNEYRSGIMGLIDAYKWTAEGLRAAADELEATGG